jgi:superfamily II DNA/RNA helicase
MFDADTVTLISRAPALDGVDLAELPQRLTRAYASIVSTRIRLRETEGAGALPGDIAEIIRELKRLAYSHEAFVSVLAQRENRAAAAFVAGAAHHVSLLAEKVREEGPRTSNLSLQAISPEVSAALLFLIAEASADAAEMAKSIVVQTDDLVEAALLTAIDHLANGRLRRILDISVPASEQFLATDLCGQAVRALYYLLFHGVRAMAAAMLGDSDEVELVEADPNLLFDRVKSLCVEPLDDLFDDEEAAPYSLYPGPLHLASLLSAVANDLSSSALVNVPPPGGIDGGHWSGVMQEIAERRPYLWRNHREAIAAGYLEPGTSAAISFPTGAGKSTIAELKIAATLLRGAKVIFLAPTLALVDQTARALTATFPKAEVQRERAEELLFDFDGEALPAISVMTPERCLAMLSFDREVFSHVALLVFDECHLLHPRETDRSRRAIDAMLCVLNFTHIAPEADLLLLSAMMMNTEEIAGWIQDLTGRPCLSLALTWKPTRQVRGCVVYGASEINVLKARLQEVRAQVNNKDAPAALRRELTVQPFGFFCLRQTWQSNARQDYALLPLLENTVTLATGTAKDRRWYLTPNGNQVASAIAEATARQHLKTLVFTQTIPLANSAANFLSSRLGRPSCALTEDEKRLYAVAVDEAGGTNRVYIEVDAAGELVSSSACHHGLLLPAERHLHESLFKRPDGIGVLVATSTLAQGMNLPSEVVIIGGDSRFDPGTDRMERLEAHELLNAAGRAGRAGDGSYGFVLVVPSKVVDFNNETNTIHNHWADLQAIFSQSDQCLVIDDPMTPLLDQIHIQSVATSTMAKYLIRRLPLEESQDGDGGDTSARNLLNRSFAAYRARARGDQAWVDTRIEAAMVARRADPEAPEVLTWADRLAAAAGVPIGIIRDLGDALAAPLPRDTPMLDWCNWFAAWLGERPHSIPALIRRESLEGLFGTEYKNLEEDEQQGQYALPRIVLLLGRWMAGDTLADLDRAFGTQERLIGKCESAREFVLRIVPELAYIFGLPGQVFQALAAENGEPVDPPLGLGTLGPCVREGVDKIEKLALRQYRRGRVSRRAIHREFASIESYLGPSVAGETFSAAITRVKNAVDIAVVLG